MTEEIKQAYPEGYSRINDATQAAGFTMASDVLTGSLLRTLAASKPQSSFLELGTGTGLSTAWILDGMDLVSTCVSVDHEAAFLEIAQTYLGSDQRLQLICQDGAQWVAENKTRKFDFIFADTWHGKYLLLDEVLNMLNPGGLYIIDDMLPQPNWPTGHDQKVKDLITILDSKDNLTLTKQVWSTGIIMAVKKQKVIPPVVAMAETV